MARLPNYQDTPLRSDIIKLLHDEVVSLCQKNYSSVSGLEIDGIICISILDTKEQQVVKIHKTLKSVFAEAPYKKKSRRDEYNAPSIWLQSDADKLRRTPGSRERSAENYSDDINALSNLLRDTNAAINEEERVKFDSVEADPKERKSKRKRKQPIQRSTIDIPPMYDIAEDCVEATNNVQAVDSEHGSDRTQNNVGIPGINPFIHQVTVKEEKVDPDYEQAELTQPKIVSVSSMSCDAAPSIDNPNNSSDNPTNTQTVTKVSSLIERLIDKEIQVPITESRISVPKESEANPQIEENLNSEATEDLCAKDTENDTGTDNDTGYKEVVVKVEKDIDYNEYSVYQEAFNSDTPVGLDSGTGDNSEVDDGPSNDIYPDGALSYGHEDGMENPNATEQEQQDPSRKSWIEMVKDNVSKYQAALMRGTKSKKKVEKKHIPPFISVPVVQTSDVSKNAGLVALLKKPASSLPNTSDILLNAHSEMSRHSRGSSVPSHGTNIPAERSSSLSPVVKIEVDEDMSSDMYSQSDGEVSSHRDNRDAPIEVASTSDGRQENAGVTTGPQGKLESRYPALFSHLQAKKINYGEQDQADSLVNRLPFISFQELFSQSSSGSPLPKLNEATTMELLAKARLNPYPAKEKKNGAKKKTWNWKKRQVRPKDANGRIISPITTSAKYGESVSYSANMPMKKTFTKKFRKTDEDDDVEWTPYSAEEVGVDSNDATGVGGEVYDGPGSKSHRTRLSCSEKPRINFAELDVSDIEMEEDEMVEDDMKIIKLEPGMNHSQSQSMNNFYMEDTSDQHHTDQHHIDVPSGASAVPGSYNSNSNKNSQETYPTGSASSYTSNSQCKCTICGLEFNQEYRWQYHMIKVHGVSADRIKLFR